MRGVDHDGRAGPGLRDVTLTVDRAEVVALLGPAGAGKTQIARIATGFATPDEGDVVVDGYDVTDPDGRWRALRRLGYVPRHPGLPGYLTGDELLDHVQTLRGGAGRIAVRARFQVPLDRRIRALDPLQRRQVAIMQAFQHSPEVVVLDQPTRDLDDSSSRAVWELVQDRRDAGASILWCTDDLAVARTVADRVAVLREGRVAAVEPVAAVDRKCGKVVEIWFQDRLTGPLIKRLRFPGVVAIYAIEDDGLRMIVRDNMDLLVRRLDELSLVDFNARDATLDDVWDHFWARDAPDPVADPAEFPGGAYVV